MGDALFGYTGLVGGNLLTKYKFDYLYNQKNILDSMNKTFDTIFISCVPAVKWIANKEPENDFIAIEKIKDIFKTIKAKQVILISTIDIYNNINNKSNENTIIDYNNNHTYGKNRYLFEQFIKDTFTNYHIIRLPALFGIGLKKNIIFDLLNNNNVDKISINTLFQWYNLEWIKEDIDICIKNKLSECNLFTEPLETIKILEFCKPLFGYDYTNNTTNKIIYDTTTINDKYFVNGFSGYIRNKEMVFESIKEFINNYIKVPKYKLCVSNISNNTLNYKQYYSILKHYNIKYIEIAPTKYNSWDNLFNNIDCFKDVVNEINNHNLELYSFQSVTFTIDNNIFDDNNMELLLHLKNVIDFACNNNVKNIVFGCPKNRRIININQDNDNIFIDFMIKLGDYIGDRDLIISIENNSKKYNCNYLNTINEVGYITKKINHKNIRMMVDIGNCIMDNDNINNLCDYKDYINHIHISMPYMNPLINYNKVLYDYFINMLNGISYDKIISLEFLNNSNNEFDNLITSLKNFNLV